MGDSPVPHEETFSGAESAEEATNSTRLQAHTVNHFHRTVIKVGHAGIVNSGDNHGTLNLSSGPSNSAAGNQQDVICQAATDLIRLLRPILDASHARDRKLSPPDSACFAGTRIDVIRRIVDWADSTLLWNTHVLWLHGYVGCGKSAIALAIALKFERRNRLVGSFFFFRNTGDRSRMVRFATTLACQLAASIPEAAPFIEKAVKEPGLLQSGSVVAQLRRLVYEPFKAAAKRSRLLKTFLLRGPFLIIVDGLDECEDRQDVQDFVDDMLVFFKKNPLVPLRFLITSRVEQHIEGHLNNKQVRLENLVNNCLRDDIDTFVAICFEEEKKRNPVIRAFIQKHGDWPTKEDKSQLVDHINGSFIFASALFKYIVDPTDDQLTPMERLPHTLNMNPGLDTLYARTLSRSQRVPHFTDVISAFALLFEPLPIVEIAKLLGIETYEVVRVLVNLQAIIHIPGTDDLPVTMCHTSLRDFLTTETRSGAFFVSPSYHVKLSYHCFRLNLESNTPELCRYYRENCQRHWTEFTATMPPPSIHAGLEQLSHFPDRGLSYYLFSFNQSFFYLFKYASGLGCFSFQARNILISCLESLALALECDPAPGRWLQRTFRNFGSFSGGINSLEWLHCSRIQEHATTLQCHVKRVETVIRAKDPSSLLGSYPSEAQVEFLEDWTAASAYKLFEKINELVQAEIVEFARSGDQVLDLYINRWSRQIELVRKTASPLPSASSLAHEGVDSTFLQHCTF